MEILTPLLTFIVLVSACAEAEFKAGRRVNPATEQSGEIEQVSGDQNEHEENADATPTPTDSVAAGIAMALKDIYQSSEAIEVRFNRNLFSGIDELSEMTVSNDATGQSLPCDGLLFKAGVNLDIDGASCAIEGDSLVVKLFPYHLASIGYWLSGMNRVTAAAAEGVFSTATTQVTDFTQTIAPALLGSVSDTGTYTGFFPLGAISASEDQGSGEQRLLINSNSLAVFLY